MRAIGAGDKLRSPNVKWMPNDGELVDLFARFTDDAVLRRKVLVDNPRRLAWKDTPLELDQERPVAPRQNERSTI
jgi:hypothetical protein